MRYPARYVIGGVAIGAVVGALIAWGYTQVADVSPPTPLEGEPPPPKELDPARLARLALQVVGVVRQVLALA